MEKTGEQGNTLIHGCGFFVYIEYPVFSSGYGHRNDLLIHVPVCTSILCLAKEDPDTIASICPMIQSNWNGLVCSNVDPACWSDPT